jgi:L-fuconolactonase
MRLDSHQHFWNYSSSEYAWISDQMGLLQHDYLPRDLKPLLESIHFDGCIAVQARQNLEETRWLLELTEEHTFIKGVVGWVDLCSDTVRDQLKTFTQHSKLVGVRHVLQDEADDNFMLRQEFRRGLAQLRRFHLTYDLLVYPKHLVAARQLVEEFPQQAFVLDHIAKPAIAEGQVSPWKEDLLQLAKLPNVSCKLSGMVTEAKWKHWCVEDFHRYLDIVIEAFGTERVMIGSDWPVCTLSGDYESTMRIVIDYVRRFPSEVREAILGGNCARFYGLDSTITQNTSTL